MTESVGHVVGLFDECDVKDGLRINFVRRPLKVIFKEIEAKLDPKTMEWFDYWGVSYPWSAHKQETDARMPAYRWIAIYHVEGGSEGHWVHVAAIIQENEIDKHICFHWTNLQPLSGIENRQKSDKLLLHYYFNNIVNVNCFNTKYTQYLGYQTVNESLQWLRIELRYGKNPPYDDVVTTSEIGNPQPSL